METQVIGKRKVVVQVVFACIVLLALSGIVSPPIALTLGLGIALTVGNPWVDASHKASRMLLQWSVAGLGLGMNLTAVWQAGRTGFWFTVVTIFGALLLGTILGRLLRIEPQTALLVSSGTSICGGSAIAAVGSVINAEARAMSVSLATVFILNAVALFIFPPIGHLLGMNQGQFGLWAAIAIHDTSSVVGAAAKYGQQALNIATTVKLARALWIFPIALGLAFIKRGAANKVKFPWFILWFLAAAAFRTLLPGGAPVYGVGVELAKHGLTLALFLIGAGLSREAVKSVGVRPMIQGVLLWIVVASCGLLAVRGIAQ